MAGRHDLAEMVHFRAVDDQGTGHQPLVNRLLKQRVREHRPVLRHMRLASARRNGQPQREGGAAHDAERNVLLPRAAGWHARYHLTAAKLDAEHTRAGLRLYSARATS